MRKEKKGRYLNKPTLLPVKDDNIETTTELLHRFKS